MRYFMIITGILITFTFLLAILAGSVQASEATPIPAKDTQPMDAAPLIYLALVGGATVLAGIIWLGTLRSVERFA